MAIAMSASVTVSIGDETRGAFNVIFLVNGEDRSTASAAKSMYPGRMRKSLEGHIVDKITVSQSTSVRTS